MVREDTQKLSGNLGQADRRKMDEYLTSVREIEVRIQNAEKSNSPVTPGIEKPSGIPVAFGDYVSLMFDLQLAALRADVTREHREVWLDKGEAYFEVAHDKAHPFTIYAGKRKVTVLGTKFSVRRNGDEVQVTVVEGKVRVDPVDAPKPTPPAVLTPGQIAIAKGAATLVTPKTLAAAQSELSWRQGMLVFDQYTVERAAEEFNRYNRRKIVVTSPEAADIRIGGTFETDNIDGFVELLQQGYGLKIEKTDDTVKITG